MKTCQYCGTTNRADAPYCNNCGGALTLRPGNVQTAPTAKGTAIPPISFGDDNAAVDPVSEVRQRTVFVSHAHADNPLCDRYVTAMRARGLDVWYDRTNMQDGHFLSTDIERELERRTGFVVLLTPASVASYWVNLEVSAFRSLAAQDPTRMMLPVRIADCRVPLLMTGIKWVDAVTLGFDTAINAMATALGAPPKATPLSVAPTPKPAESVEELLSQGKALKARKKYAEAIPYLERATQRDPRSFDAWANLGYVRNECGRHADGLDAYDRALALDPTSGPAWHDKGAALEGLGRCEEALAAYDRALALDPNDAFAWYGKSKALLNQFRYTEAIPNLERATQLDPCSFDAWSQLGLAYIQVSRPVDCLLACDRALDLYANKAWVWNIKGYALVGLKRFVEAHAAIERALDLSHANTISWHIMATVLRALGRTAEAEEAERQVTKFGRRARNLTPDIWLVDVAHNWSPFGR
jgi:tetratricopeptide (TPR) repeat protein